MRKINTGDVFKMARLLKNGNVISIVRNAYEEGRKEDADGGRVGMDVVMEVLASCTDAGCEAQVYDILAGICEKTEEEIKNQSLECTVGEIKKICTENNIVNFLKSAAGSGMNLPG